MNNARLKVIALLLALTGNVFAQQYIAQDGHLLDANNRIGSMGWNGSGSIDALNNRNNNIMTGTISGGQSFQGSVPYRSTMQFQGVTNTNTLSNFRRDSVNVNTLGDNTPRLYVDSGVGVAGGFGSSTILTPQSDYRISTILNPRVQSRVTGNIFDNSLGRGREQGLFGDRVNNFRLLPGTLSVVAQPGKNIDNHLAIRSMANTRLTPEIDTRAFGYQKALTFTNKLSYDQLNDSGSQQADDPEREIYFPTDQSDRLFDQSQSGDNLIITQGQTEVNFRQRYEQYRNDGLEYLKNGKYYKAINSLGQAEIYAQSEDSELMRYLVLSRFAAGEYIGASLDLWQVFNISFEKAVATDINIDELFESDLTIYYGIKDLERFYEITNNDSMLFLMAWIKYQADDKNAALVTMRKLTELIPDNELYQKFQEYIAGQIK